MYKVPPTWPAWPAVGAQLERGVRPHPADDSVVFTKGGAPIGRPVSAEGGAGAVLRRRGVCKGVASREASRGERG
jgi:hypothetical protein